MQRDVENSTRGFPCVFDCGLGYGGWGQAGALTESCWRRRLNDTFLDVNLGLDDTRASTRTEEAGDIRTRNQAVLPSYFDLSRDWEFDTALHFVANLSGLDADSYARLDARLARRPREDVELSVVGQNLLDNQRAEFRFGECADKTDASAQGMVG